MVRRLGRNVDVAIGEQSDRLTGADNLRLPKGRIKEGETPEQAAIREVREETGLVARVVAPLGAATYAYRDVNTCVSKQVLYFLMEFVSGDPQPRDEEMRSVRWCPIDEAARTLTFDTERGAVERARTRLGSERVR